MERKVNEMLIRKLSALVLEVSSFSRISAMASFFVIILNAGLAFFVAEDEGKNSIYIIGLIAGIFVLPQIYRIFTLRKYKEKIKKQYPNLSVVGIMSLKREKSAYYSITVLIFSLMLYVSPSILGLYSVNLIVVTILLSGAALLLIREKLVQFRVNSGFYGQNESEAREIINFILSNSNDIDFTDGGKKKPIFSENNIEEVFSNSFAPSSARVKVSMPRA